ncbi:histidine kinase [Noviherbaspirillum cavernae]|uniref:histidine kinase n=1 Tax=Noviherbaspirillum cavernae TaxID=2320862 RepID=A0A418WYY5_9BURK|nr:sensor histidine kinase [Noviherbaspirillum cavernae]RJG05391.1 histidine kinase [Noviherbaspirillum cavernae]
MFGLICLLPGLRTAWAAVADPLRLQAPNATWLRDSGARLTIDEAAARADEFQPLYHSLSRGYTRDAYWLRLTLPADMKEGELWLEVPSTVLDDVRLYEPRTGGWTVRRSGDTLPFDTHEGPYRTASFRLAQPHPGEVMYLRIETTSVMAVSPRLWRAPALQTANNAANLGYGWYLGFMFTVALFNLVSWATTRHGIYGIFAMSVVATATRWFAVDGLAGEFVFPHDASVPALLTNSLLGLQALCDCLCQARLLQLRGNFPRLLHFYRLVMLLGVLIIFSPLYGYYGLLATMVFICAMLAPLLSIPAYLRLWRTGNLSGRLIAVSLPLYFVVMLPNYLGSLGFMPHDPATMNSAHLASLPLVLALHLSLVLRARDVERARNEAQRQANDALATSRRERSAREEQDRFLSMITHEVRTPVAVIDAAAHSLRLLDQIGADPAQRNSRYQSIKQAVGRMKTLMELAEVQDRLLPGTSQSNTGSLDLATLSRDALSALEPVAAARVAIEADVALPPLKGDTRLLYFALLNLLDNAVKYAHPDTLIRIGIVTDMKTRGVLWRIKDHGPGIPTGKEEAIFEKYRRLDETAAQSGLGLGLSLARQIVEKHDGHLRLDRSWPHGACFEIWLPEAA